MHILRYLTPALAASATLLMPSIGGALIATEYYSTDGPRRDCSNAFETRWCHDLPRNVNTDVCVLTGLTGDREADDSHQGLYLTKMANGTYTFLTDDHEDGRGWARCMPWSAFIKNQGDVTWYSDLVFASCQTSLAGGSCSASANLWKGDAWSVLQGSRGEMEGGGEWARVDQATTASSLSKARARTETGNFLMPASMHAAAQSFFIGVPGSTRLAPLIGYRNGSWVKGNINSSGTFTFDVSTTEGYSSYWLAPHAQGLCYMTRINGDFNGSGESVRITVNGNNYFVTARAGNGKARGSVRCMAYDTR